jgi:hypothetical protein
VDPPPQYREAIPPESTVCEALRCAWSSPILYFLTLFFLVAKYSTNLESFFWWYQPTGTSPGMSCDHTVLGGAAPPEAQTPSQKTAPAARLPVSKIHIFRPAAGGERITLPSIPDLALNSLGEHRIRIYDIYTMKKCMLLFLDSDRNWFSWITIHIIMFFFRCTFGWTMEAEIFVERIPPKKYF